MTTIPNQNAEFKILFPDWFCKYTGDTNHIGSVNPKHRKQGKPCLYLRGHSSNAYFCMEKMKKINKNGSSVEP